MKGIHTPYLYAGSPLSSFAIHLEDGDLFSINYLHHGMPKIWYLIPKSEESKLEKLMAENVEYAFVKCNLYIRHKNAMILLETYEINFARVVQYPGEGAFQARDKTGRANE